MPWTNNSLIFQPSDTTCFLSMIIFQLTYRIIKTRKLMTTSCINCKNFSRVSNYPKVMTIIHGNIASLSKTLKASQPTLVNRRTHKNIWTCCLTAQKICWNLLSKNISCRVFSKANSARRLSVMNAARPRIELKIFTICRWMSRTSKTWKNLSLNH